MKTAIRQTSSSDSSPAGTASNLCSVENDSTSSHGSGCQVPVRSSCSASAISAFDGLRPVALSLFANITWPSAGETIIPSSRGIGRSGSRQKLAKKAESMSMKIPKLGATPNKGSTNHPTSMNPLPIKAGVITGRNPPLAKKANLIHLTGRPKCHRRFSK